MVMSDLLRFENPNFVIFLFSLLAFVLVFIVLSRIIGNRSVSLVAAFAISAMAGWYMYVKDISKQEIFLGILFILIVAVIIGKILVAFGKGAFGVAGR